MKLLVPPQVGRNVNVLPLTREWIEISLPFDRVRVIGVLPLTREWIEMPSS